MTCHSSLQRKKVDLALKAICTLYDVQIKDVLNTRYRKKPLPDARRMLVHYMFNQLRIPHYHMKRYINGICHATSIYHCKILDGYLDIEPQTKRLYLQFRDMAGEFDDDLLKIDTMKMELNKLTKDLNKIIKKING
jgi:hypothetical protein